MDNTEIGGGCIDWICMTEDMDQLRAVVNTVMYLQVP
jgi:hypothetical protein